MKRRLRGYFIAGTLALVPLTITYLSLRCLFAALDAGGTRRPSRVTCRIRMLSLTLSSLFIY